MGIVEYLEEQGLTVKYARGGWQAVRCPYHGDRNASASVNIDTGKFHCFACGIHEDVIGLIRQDTGVSYVEAVETAAQKYGTGLDPMADMPANSLTLPPRQRHRRTHSGKVPSWRSSFA